jgi:hypothetical protein
MIPTNTSKNVKKLFVKGSSRKPTPARTEPAIIITLGPHRSIMYPVIGPWIPASKAENPKMREVVVRLRPRSLASGKKYRLKPLPKRPAAIAFVVAPIAAIHHPRNGRRNLPPRRFVISDSIFRVYTNVTTEYI